MFLSVRKRNGCGSSHDRAVAQCQGGSKDRDLIQWHGQSTSEVSGGHTELIVWLLTYYLCGSPKASKWELGEVLADTLLSWTLWSIPIQEGAVTDRPEHLESRSSWHLTGLFPFLTVVGFFLGRFQMSARNPRAHPYAVRSPSQSSVKGLHFQVQDEWSLRNFPDIADFMITSLFSLCHLAWMPPTFFRWFEQRTHQKV